MINIKISLDIFHNTLKNIYFTEMQIKHFTII